MCEDGQLCLRKGNLHIFRSKLLWKEEYYEHIRFMNYDQENCSFNVSFTVDADYVDIFEIHGMERGKRGVIQELELQKNQIKPGYTGLDNILYQTKVEFDPELTSIKKNLAKYSLSLNAQESQKISLHVSCTKQQQIKKAVTFATAYECCRKKPISSRAGFVDLFSSNEQFNDWLGRSAADLRLLISDYHGWLINLFQLFL